MACLILFRDEATPSNWHRARRAAVETMRSWTENLRFIHRVATVEAGMCFINS